MKGVVDKIWENKTDDGKPYFVVRIAWGWQRTRRNAEIGRVKEILYED
jgi:hypothetical protein